MEDDVIMRVLTRKLLEEHGYRVLEAEDGRSALNVIGSVAAPIDLILTDVAMKGMNGPELVQRVIASHPRMKIVYMSGYASQLIADQDIDSGIRFLEKPFPRVALLKTVDAVLGEAGSPGARVLPDFWCRSNAFRFP
jgi:DNA-binding NtrC family response regulator